LQQHYGCALISKLINDAFEALIREQKQKFK